MKPAPPVTNALRSMLWHFVLAGVRAGVASHRPRLDAWRGGIGAPNARRPAFVVAMAPHVSWDACGKKPRERVARRPPDRRCSCSGAAIVNHPVHEPVF